MQLRFTKEKYMQTPTPNCGQGWIHTAFGIMLPFLHQCGLAALATVLTSVYRLIIFPLSMSQMKTPFRDVAAAMQLRSTGAHDNE